MRQKLLFSLLLLFCVIPVSSSCRKDNNPDNWDNLNLSVSTERIDISYEACTQEITVTSDCDWGVASEDKSWCRVSPSGGVAGTSKVLVTIAENKVYKERNTEIVFSFGSNKITIPVQQACKEKPAMPEVPTPEGYTLVWNDEFEGDAVDTKKWTFENWAPGRVNNELQRYVAGGVLDGVKTAFVEDGILNIRAIKHKGQVISARMNSKESWTYGYMEASIKLPKGKGTWPAFWMMPNDFSLGWPACGEIDIMEEVGVNPNYTSSSIHTKSYNHVMKTQKTKEIYTAGAENDFHIYAVEWTKDYLQFYTDGKPQLFFKNDAKGNNDTWPFNKSFYIILNLAWGGDWGGWNGVNENALPCCLQFDYVRVFQKQ